MIECPLSPHQLMLCPGVRTEDAASCWRDHSHSGVQDTVRCHEPRLMTAGSRGFVQTWDLPYIHIIVSSKKDKFLHKNLLSTTRSFILLQAFIRYSQVSQVLSGLFNCQAQGQGQGQGKSQSQKSKVKTRP